MAQTRTLEALRILETRLVTIEQDYQTELADHEELRDKLDTQAEARALTAILEFLETCRIRPQASLLRLFRRYLHAEKDKRPATMARRVPQSRAS